MMFIYFLLERRRPSCIWIFTWEMSFNFLVLVPSMKSLYGFFMSYAFSIVFKTNAKNYWTEINSHFSWKPDLFTSRNKNMSIITKHACRWLCSLNVGISFSLSFDPNNFCSLCTCAVNISMSLFFHKADVHVLIVKR